MSHAPDTVRPDDFRVLTYALKQVYTPKLNLTAADYVILDVFKAGSALVVHYDSRTSPVVVVAGAESFSIHPNGTVFLAFSGGECEIQIRAFYGSEYFYVPSRGEAKPIIRVRA